MPKRSTVYVLCGRVLKRSLDKTASQEKRAIFIGKNPSPLEQVTAPAAADAKSVEIPAAGGRKFAGFDAERATFERHRAGLRDLEGKFVVIRGEEMLPPLDSYEDALTEGYRRFGLGPLYVRQVLAEEPISTTTRPISPCPA